MEQIYILKEQTKNIIKSPDAVFKNISKFNIDYTQENFIVFYLNTKNKLMGSEVLFKGGLNSCMVCPKTIFRRALIKNSNSIIIAHNHPSGDLQPSDEDREITCKIKEIGELLSLQLLDSIIFNKKQYYRI